MKFEIDAKGNKKGSQNVPNVIQKATICINKSLRVQEHVFGGASLRKGCHFGAAWPSWGPMLAPLDFEGPLRLVFLDKFGAAKKQGNKNVFPST